MNFLSPPPGRNSPSNTSNPISTSSGVNNNAIIFFIALFLALCALFLRLIPIIVKEYRTLVVSAALAVGIAAVIIGQVIGAEQAAQIKQAEQAVQEIGQTKQANQTHSLQEVQNRITQLESLHAQQPTHIGIITNLALLHRAVGNENRAEEYQNLLEKLDPNQLWTR